MDLEEDWPGRGSRVGCLKPRVTWVPEKWSPLDEMRFIQYRIRLTGPLLHHLSS